MLLSDINNPPKKRSLLQLDKRRKKRTIPHHRQSRFTSPRAQIAKMELYTEQDAYLEKEGLLSATKHVWREQSRYMH
jgi:hypothetical protein